MNRITTNLQQQKLQKLTSPHLCNTLFNMIYNSRNYRSLLARRKLSSWRLNLQQQKLQKLTSQSGENQDASYLQQQKLQKLTSLNSIRQAYNTYIYNSRNYRSLLAKIGFSGDSNIIYNSRNYRSLLAQQSFNSFFPIYNSRNYRSLLAQLGGSVSASPSTIVEIIEAYQPRMSPLAGRPHLQQQKLQKLTSPLSTAKIQKILETTAFLLEYFGDFIHPSH